MMTTKICFYLEFLTNVNPKNIFASVYPCLKSGRYALSKKLNQNKLKIMKIFTFFYPVLVVVEDEA